MRSASIRSSGKWSYADEQHQPLAGVVAHAVRNAGRRPDGVTLSGGSRLATNDEPPFSGHPRAY